jgi:hypothetical protein
MQFHGDSSLLSNCASATGTVMLRFEDSSAGPRHQVRRG